MLKKDGFFYFDNERLIDIMMVSQLGTTAVAAVGLGNRVFFFNLLVIAGLSGGVSVLAAQYYGRGELAGVRRSLALALRAERLDGRWRCTCFGLLLSPAQYALRAA